MSLTNCNAPKSSRWSSLLYLTLCHTLTICSQFSNRVCNTWRQELRGAWVSRTKCFLLSMKLSEYDGSRGSECQPMQAFVQSFILLEIIHHWLSVLSIIPASGPADSSSSRLLIGQLTLNAAFWLAQSLTRLDTARANNNFFLLALTLDPTIERSLRASQIYIYIGNIHPRWSVDPLNVIISDTSADAGWQTEILFITRSSAVSCRQWYKNSWYSYITLSN